MSLIIDKIIALRTFGMIKIHQGQSLVLGEPGEKHEIKSIIKLNKQYFIFAVFGVAILSIILYLGYSLIYKNKLKGKKL